MTMLKELWTKFRVYIIGALVIIGLGILAGVYINSYYNLKNYSNHNLEALSDSIKYYKSKNGDLVAEKKILIGDMSTLKIANKELYDKVKNMKVSDPSQVVYMQGEIIREPSDTVWNTDTIIPNLNLKKNFAFNDTWRKLEGNVFANDSTLGLHIDKDEMYFDYTTVIKDGSVYISSSNPYVKYNEITGITLPNNKKKWSIGIGPSIGYGYDFIGKKFSPYIGIGLNFQYNLFQWGSK